MCHADISMWTIAWAKNEKGEIDYKPQSSGERTCVKWESLDRWAKRRVAPAHRIFAQPDLSKLHRENINHKV